MSDVSCLLRGMHLSKRRIHFKVNERHIDVEGIFLSILTYKRSLWQFMRHLRSSSGLLYCPLPPLAPSSCLGLWVSPQHCPFKSAQMPPSEGSFPAKHTLAGHTPSASPRWVSFSIALTSTCPVVCLSVCWLSASYPQPPCSWEHGLGLFIPLLCTLALKQYLAHSKCAIQICWMKDTASGD